MTSLGNHTVLVSRALIDIVLPDGYKRIDVAEDEPHGGNVLRIGKTLIHAKSFPHTAESLQTFARENGLTLLGLDISQAQAGDGALTCQSILW
jgi:hypothetical protein